MNGEKLARHEGGFSAFRVDLTAHLRTENTLAITVDNTDNDTVYPQKADFTFYGGLYRAVKLLVVPAAHFALGYCGAPGIKVTPVVDLAAKTAVVTAEAWVEGGHGGIYRCRQNKNRPRAKRQGAGGVHAGKRSPLGRPRCPVSV